MFIDSHAHIDGEEFDADRDEVLARARGAGVDRILNVGTGDPHGGSLERAVELAERCEDVYAAVGVHPHDARLFDEAAAERVRGIVRGSERVVAWGEIGLDYHYDNSPREAQREVFRAQLRMAREESLPVIIHSREADEDTVAILEDEWRGSARAGVLHCFGGGLWMAERALALGFYVSFAGTVTFKKAVPLREIARRVPLERLLIETDCPFLAPVPLRGRRNEPAFVVETARFLASLRGEVLEDFARATSSNFARLFDPAGGA
ncbi:MAG: TatD family hydrolase [Acidobacteria bacterium]|nr:TatD family hydrolase [Acidobacteriota bacterium]MCA1643844.1 TatD family hydrolase [Acidobacteriota bacterium]